MKTIGIPQGLLYHRLGDFWRRFFEELGYKVVVSEDTTKKILGLGLKASNNELCLPVKIFYGHVLDIKDKVDYLFIPVIMTGEKNTYHCPKIIAAADMIKNTLTDLPPILSPTLDWNNKVESVTSITKTMAKYGVNPLNVVEAYRKALTTEQPKKVQKGMIGVIGKPYLLRDKYLIMPIIQKLSEMKIKPVFMDQEKIPQQKQQTRWITGQEELEAAEHYANKRSIKGIIYLTAFGCATDAFIEAEIEEIAKGKKPLLKITIDEHQGKAGLMTRIEAFMDMIR